MCKEIDLYFDEKMRVSFNGNLKKIKKASPDKYPQMHWIYACIEEWLKNQGINTIGKK